MPIVFNRISPDIAARLLDFASHKNIGKDVQISGEKYTVEHISRSSSKYHKSRGLSVYFRHKRSVVRISDHWSSSNHFSRSKKLNCGFIDNHSWQINNRADDKIECSKFSAGKYPFVMLAGMAGLSLLNKTCEHWKPQ